MTDSETLLEVARAIAEDETVYIPIPVMLLMCQAFEGHYWVGTFDHRAITMEGSAERVMALCMAASVQQWAEFIAAHADT